MSESRAESQTVTLTPVFDAPITLVYSAWAEAEHVTKWMKCDVQAHLEVENWVPAVGAQFRTHMWQTDVFEAWSIGRFTEVNPPRVLAYVIDADPKLGVPEMRVRVELKDLSDNRTEVTLTQSGIPNDMIFGVIHAGWTASLAQLETVVHALFDANAPAEERP